MDILKCDHAVLLPPGNRPNALRVCGDCHVEEIERERARATPEAKRTLKELVKQLGGTDALLELLGATEKHEAAKRKGLERARAALAAKRLNGAGQRAEMATQ